MISYSKFEGLKTEWYWLDKILCKFFGHPDRRYYVSDRKGTTPLCARCMREM